MLFPFFFTFLLFYFCFFSYLCALNEKGKNASAGLKMALNAKLGKIAQLKIKL